MAWVAWGGCGGASVATVPDAGDSSSDAGEPDTTDPDVTQDSGEGTEESSDDGDPSAEAPSRCGDGLADGEEECDGADLKGQSCETMGADGTLACNDDCTFDTCGCTWEGEPPACEAGFCGNGSVEPGEACDGGIEGTDGWIPTCADLLLAPYVGEPTCASDCTYDTSGCTLCGNGVVDDGEACDTAGPPCSELGLGLGTAACTASCELDTAACTLCGNGVVDDGEPCDGDAIPTTCGEQGFTLGSVSCDGACGLDLSSCSTCGDGVISGDEACDPAAPGLCLCNDACTVDLEKCASLIISEILYAPLADPDAKPGQWIELHNPTAIPFDLQGCVVSGDLGIDTFDIDVSVVATPGGYITLGAGTALELGFAPDFPMPIGVGLFNDGDVVTITCDDVVLDTVLYDDGAPWPAAPPGTSIALGRLDATSNDDGAAWCMGSTPYGPGHLGTPGAPNDCP